MPDARGLKKSWVNKMNRKSVATDVHKAKIWEPMKKITAWQKTSSDLLTYCSRMFWLSEGWMVSKMVRQTERRKVCLLLSRSQGASFGSGVPPSPADESQQGILKKQGKHSPHHAVHCWPLSEAEPLGSSSRTLISTFTCWHGKEVMLCTSLCFGEIPTASSSGLGGCIIDFNPTHSNKTWVPAKWTYQSRNQQMSSDEIHLDDCTPAGHSHATPLQH